MNVRELAKKFTGRDYLYVAGALASLIALFVLFKSGKISWSNIGTPLAGTQTDAEYPGTPAIAGTSGPTGYTNYNYGPLDPTSAVSQANVPPGDTSAGSCGCNSPSAYGCAGASQLDTGSYTNDNQLYNFLEQINPTWQQAQLDQMQDYAEYFATGSTYNSGGLSINVANN